MGQTPRLDRAIETVTRLRNQVNAGENWSEQVIGLRLKDVLDELLLARVELSEEPVPLAAGRVDAKPATKPGKQQGGAPWLD